MKLSFVLRGNELKVKNYDEAVKKALLKTGFKGIEFIGNKMDSGTTIKGAPFKPYSKSYAAFRRKKGRSTKPDLQFTRRMRQSMTVKATSEKATIFFSRPEEAKKAAWNNKTRPFFGFSTRQTRRLADVFKRALT
jgi:hypothetical protein